MNKIKIPRASFSWKRALGITKLKQKISRQTSVPITKNGTQNWQNNTIYDIQKINR